MKRIIVAAFVVVLVAGFLPSVGRAESNNPSPVFLAQLSSVLQDLLRQVQALQQQLIELAKKEAVQSSSQVSAPSTPSQAGNFNKGYIVLDELEGDPQVSCLLPIFSAASVYPRNSIYLVQIVLKKAGHYPEGLITGYYGRLTRAAVSRFQNAKGLSATGNLDEKTASALSALVKNYYPECGGGPINEEPKPGTPFIKVLSPNGGENWYLGSSQAIQWSGGNTNRVVIDFLDQNSKEAFSGIQTVVSNYKNGYYSWTIPSNVAPGQYRIRINNCPDNQTELWCANADLSAYGFDISDSAFSVISGPPTIQYFTVSDSDQYPGAKFFSWTATPGSLSNFTVACQSGLTITQVVPSNAPFACGDLDRRVVSDGSDVLRFINSTGATIITTVSLCPIGGANEKASCRYLSITVPVTQAPITILSPNGGEVFTKGTSRTITWTANNSYGATVPIYILQKQGASFYNVLTVNTYAPNTGSYAWTPPSTLADGSNYYVQIGCWSYGFASTPTCNGDISDAPFSIVAAPPSISITGSSGSQSSNTAITVSQGNQITISGTPLNLTGLSYFTDYTRAFFFDPIFNGLCSNNSASEATWTMTCTASNTGTSNFYIEIYRNGQTYKSNVVTVTVFVTPPLIAVISPNGGEQYTKGSPVQFVWNQNYNALSLMVYLYSPTLGNMYSGPISGGVGKNTDSLSGEAVNVPAGQYKINICDEKTDNPVLPGKPLCDLSDSYFTIY